MREAIDGWHACGTDVVLACSALKRAYRDALRAERVRFVYLDVNRAMLEQRLAIRESHFMPAALLDSQLATLEVPTAEEALRVDGARPLREIVDAIAQTLASLR